MWKEFKAFISRGSVIDLAVGVMVGAAFTAIVNSLVGDIIMPLVALVTGGIDFSGWVIPLIGDNAITIGNFINAVISFVLIALVLFLLIRGINRLHKKTKEEVPAAPERLCPYCRQPVDPLATRCPHCTSIIES